MAHDPEQLRKEVHDAFAGRPYPGDERLALQQPGFPGYEGDTVARFFRGRDWRTLTLEALLADEELDRNAFMFFMTPEGFTYFLPAFLTLALDVDGPFDLGEPLAFKLTAPAEDAPDAWRDDHSRVVSSLSAPQQRAVMHVLEYLAGAYEQRRYIRNQAQMALESYWGYLENE
jgi:hypothetical protein